MSKRRAVWYGLFVAPSFLGLIAVGIALRTGVSPRRLLPIGGFLTLWAVSAAYDTIARRALRKRTLRQRQTSFPRGVSFHTPLWILVDRSASIFGLVAIFGTVVASAGFPQVALGVLLVVGMFAMVAVGGTIGIRALIFEDGGVRVRIRSAEYLLPWSSIQDVEQIGPDHFPMLRLRIGDMKQVIESVLPDRSNIRARVQTLLAGGEVLIEPWTAGIDGTVLARVIREGVAGFKERLN